MLVPSLPPWALRQARNAWYSACCCVDWNVSNSRAVRADTGDPLTTGMRVAPVVSGAVRSGGTSRAETREWSMRGSMVPHPAARTVTRTDERNNEVRLIREVLLSMICKVTSEVSSSTNLSPSPRRYRYYKFKTWVRTQAHTRSLEGYQKCSELAKK